MAKSTLDTSITALKEHLSNSDFFNFLSDDMHEKIIQHASVQQIKKNTRIIKTGDPSDSAYLLLEGGAIAFSTDEDGHEFTMTTIKPGDCFGELGVLDGKPRTANIRMTIDSVCLAMRSDAFHQCIEPDAIGAHAIIRSLVSRIRDMTDNMNSLALMDTYGRIARVLQQAANVDDDQQMVIEKMTHQDIANRVGSSREMVSKILKDLTAGGYIENDKKKITILKKLPDRW